MLSFEQNDISDTISIFKNKYFHIVIMKTTFLSVKFTMFKKNRDVLHFYLYVFWPR